MWGFCFYICCFGYWCKIFTAHRKYSQCFGCIRTTSTITLELFISIFLINMLLGLKLLFIWGYLTHCMESIYIFAETFCIFFFFSWHPIMFITWQLYKCHEEIKNAQVKFLEFLLANSDFKVDYSSINAGIYFTVFQTGICYSHVL